MGKVHRIKKDFYKLVSQPLKEGRHRLGGCVSLYVGRRASFRDDFFLMSFSHRRYKSLIDKLIKEYEQAGVAHSDKAPVTE